MSGVFDLIRLLLAFFGMWEEFCNYTDKIRAAAAEKKNQDRDKAIDDAKKAKTPEDAWKAQDGVVDSQP
jgi:hypothetical protein